MNNRQEFQSPNDLRNIQDAVSLLRTHSKRLDQKIQDAKASKDSDMIKSALDSKDRHSLRLSQNETLLSMLHSGEFDKHRNLSKQVDAASSGGVRLTRESSDAEWDARREHDNKILSMRAPLDGLLGKIPPTAYNHIILGVHPDWSEKLLAEVNEHISRTK